MRKTLNVKRLSATAMHSLMGRWLFDPVTITSGAVAEYPKNVERPKTRADCVDGPRPCPFVSCQHHLYLDVNPTSGAIKVNFPRLDVWEMDETCALDVADKHAGGAPLPVVAAAMGLSYDRTFQVVDEAKQHARAEANAIGDDDGVAWAREQQRAEREQSDASARITKKQGRRSK